MPQYNANTEAAQIGAVLKNPKVFIVASDIISTGDFYFNHHQWVWNIFTRLQSEGMGIDIITVGDELERVGRLQEFQSPTKQFSGRAALSWMRENSDPRNSETYAAEILDYSAKRQIEQIFIQGVNWSQNGRRAPEILADVMRKISDIRIHEQQVNNHTSTLACAISEAYDHTDAAANGKIKTVPTGFPDLDYLLGGGLMTPDFMVVAGRPGAGKTALMVSIAKRIAEAGRKAVIFSLEMTNKQIAMRLISMESGISFGSQKSGRLKDNEWAVYTNAVEKLSDKDYGITLNDLPAITISQMRRELRRMSLENKPYIVIIDYIQLQGADGDFERRDLQIGEITRGIKSLAKEFDCPFIAGAQMSRAVEQRANNRPILSDLRESGSIENDSDIVAFIHRPDKAKNEAELIIEKNRNGMVGTVDLIYQGGRTKFESATSKTFKPNL